LICNDLIFSKTVKNAHLDGFLSASGHRFWRRKCNNQHQQQGYF
jgi:hypothetical protein